MEIVEIFGFKPHDEFKAKLPFFTTSVAAGIPVPVEQDIDREIDLNEYLIEHPAATFFARVRGIKLDEVGIKDGDILVVDAAVEPTDGKIIVASVNNDITVKIYREVDGQIFLESQNHQFLPLSIEPYLEFNILGVVTRIIHSL